MAPIPAEPSDGPSGIRRGRHRKPRPRKVLLAAGGLALAAGVLSLVRVSPESGVGAPGTAEAEPRLDPGGGATDHSADTAATVAGPTALPSATSVMGGRSSTPTATRSSAPIDPGASVTSSGVRSVPTTTPIPTGAPSAPGSTPQPPATTSAPHPHPHPHPTATDPAPAPSHSTAAPAPGGGLCVPVVGLCVDVLGGPRE